MTDDQNHPNFKKRGIILLFLGALFGMPLMSMKSSSGFSAYELGQVTPALVCWIAGLYYFFKGGGKVV